MLAVSRSIKRIQSELKPLEEKMHYVEQNGTGPERADLATQISRRQIKLRKLTEKLSNLKTQFHTNQNKNAGTRRHRRKHRKTLRRK